jgi:hypothetical protein
MRLLLEFAVVAIVAGIFAAGATGRLVRRTAFEEGLTAAGEPDEDWTGELHEGDVWAGRGMWEPMPRIAHTMGEGWRVHLNGDMIPPKGLLSTHTWVGDLVAEAAGEVEPVS